MSKFSKQELEKSLINNITLMCKEETPPIFEWVQFFEIPSFLKDGFYIFNDDKRSLYEDEKRMRKLLKKYKKK